MLDRTEAGGLTRRRAWVAWVGRVFVTLVLAAVLLEAAEPRRVVAILLSAEMPLVAAAFLVAVADRLLMIAKWYPLLRVQVDSIPLLAGARAYLASGIAQYVLPASLGTDVVRTLALGRGRGAVVEVGASIVAERVLGLVAAGVMAVIALALAARHGIPLRIVAPWALAAVGLGLGALLLPMSEWVVRRVRGIGRMLPEGRWRNQVTRFGAAYAAYRRQPRLLAVVGLLSLLEQLFPVGLMWLLARALGIAIGVGPMIVAVTLTVFAARLPISVGGLGVGEGALVYLLGLYGVDASSALALALVGRVLDVIVNAGPGMFLWRDLVWTRRAGAAPASE